MDLHEIKNAMREEIARRIVRMNLELRIRVLIHDSKERFDFGPPYPREDVSALVEWIREQHEKCRGMEEGEKEMHFYRGTQKGTGYAIVTMIREFDGENHPIVEFESEGAQTQ